MPKACAVTGKKTCFQKTSKRRGSPKKKGGVGLKNCLSLGGNRMKRVLSPLLSLSALCITFAWAQSGPTVITSIHPYYALLQEIVGENAEVVRLLPPGASPHTFDPTPRDVAQLSDADLVILNGVLDEWLLDLVEASGTDAEVLEVISELSFEPVGGGEHDGHEGEGTGGERESNEAEPGEGESAEDEHDHEGVNPHIWLDPTLMAEAVPLFVGRLAEVDPENAAVYEANGEALIAELNALEAELSETLAPVRGAAFVPFHDAWPYFARHYGLDLVVEIEPAPGREPSPAYIADALAMIEGSGAKAIFSEVQLPARPAEVIAENAGLPLYLLDPVGGGEETETYAELLRYNASTIREALGSAVQ